MVILTETSNPAGYEDVDREDNSDTSSMILSVATGLDRNDRIVIIGIVQNNRNSTNSISYYNRIITKL